MQLFSGITTQKASLIYDSNGDVIKNIFDIEADDDVYLSYGEHFSKPIIQNFLDLKFYGATAYVVPPNDDLFITKRGLENDETKDSVRTFYVSSGIPNSYKVSTSLKGLKQKALKFSINDMQNKQISAENCFLQHKQYPQKLIFPSIAINPKCPALQPGFQLNSQVWVYTTDYKIRPKMFPSLFLAISQQNVKVNNGNDNFVEGYSVILSKTATTIWHATIEGEFVCSNSGLFLTALDEPADLFSRSVMSQPSEFEVSVPDCPAGEKLVLVALPPIQAVSKQRWAFRQQAISLLGQWKLCDIRNPVWKEQCLSWPVNADGSRNEKLAWPMEGLLLTCAPPLRARIVKSPLSIGTKVNVPLRLNVHKNGNIGKGRFVTAPDLTNMKKDLAIKHRTFKYQPDTVKWLEKHSKEISSEDKQKVEELEFRLFLDKCQSVLGLLSPPTRLFTRSGDEVSSLEGLNRDDEVYVSCGADFEPLDGAKISRNKLVHNISNDINKIKTFCSFLVPSSYAISVPTVKRNSPAVLQIVIEPELNFLLNTDSCSDIIHIAEQNRPFEELPRQETKQPAITEQRFHLKAHIDQNNQDLGMIEQFPWRNPAFTSGIIKNKLEWEEDNKSENESDCESVKSFKSTSSTSSIRSQTTNISYDQWIYKECRFFLVDNTQFVLGYDYNNNISLVPYNKSSVEQCWTIDDRHIFAANGQVLTVIQCSVVPPDPVDYTGSRLKLAPLQDTENGNATQKWVYDEVTGHILALASNDLCRGISAALQSKICTYSVTSSDNAVQPTYIMQNPSLPGIPGDNTHIYVCGSCATALRDRYKVEKVEATTFVCSVGYYSATNKLNLQSSFAALSGLDGLDSSKALGTLYLWESVFSDIKEQVSVKAIRDIISQTLDLECINDGLVLVRCYLNGKTPPKYKGSLFLARSFDEILRKSLLELKPGRPLSRIFYPDGGEVSRFEELINVEDEASDGSTITSSCVCYKELFVSSGEEFIIPQKTKRTLMLKKRMKMYRELKKADIVTLRSQPTNKARPPVLPSGSHITFPVYILRNGDFTSPSVRIVANSLNALLEQATSRLNLVTAARRAFFCNGTEVITWSDVSRDITLVISTGEKFIQKGRRNSSKGIRKII